jgi:hypothetical protein
MIKGLINSIKRHNNMGESGGHFEKGKWVEDAAPESSSPGVNDDIETRLRSAAGQIGRGIDELLEAGGELIGTKEGRQQLGRRLDEVTGDLIRICEDIRREGRDFINQARDRIMK